MIGDGNLFAVKRRKFHQRIADTSGYLNRAIKCVVTGMELKCSWRQGGPLRRLERNDRKRYRTKTNKTGNVRITEHCGAILQPLLLWKSNTYYIL